MLSAFKIKAFDLQHVYEEWQDGPYFNGNPKDISVEEWLDKIKEGCMRYGIPEEYWYKVAQHFMGPEAIKRPVELFFQASGNLTAPHRLDELKQVISQIHGGKYRWTWKKFCIALRNMGCMFRSVPFLVSPPTNPTLKGEINKDEKETINVSIKSPNLWFARRKNGSDANLTEEPEQEPVDKEPSRFPWRKSSRRGSVLESSHPEIAKSNSQPTPRPSARRSSTLHPETIKVHSESAVTCRTNPSPPTRSQTTPVIEIVSPEVHSSEGKPFQRSKHPAIKSNVHSKCNASTCLASERHQCA